MKFKNYKLFMNLAFLVFAIFAILSLLFDELPLLVIFAILLYGVAFIFYQFKNPNPKLYFLAAILILVLGLLVNSFLNQNFDLINNTSYVPVLGCIVLVLGITIGMKNQQMMRKSVHLIGMGKFEEALKELNKMLEIYPGDYGAMYFKACALERLEKYQGQLESADELIRKNKMDLFASKTKLNEKDILPLNIKIDALIKLKRFDEAEDLIEKILEKEPQDVSTLSNKASLLYEYGKYQEAVDYYEDSREIMNERISKLENTRKGKIMARIMPLNYGLDELLVDTGKAYMKLQKYEEALSCFDEALKISDFGASKSGNSDSNEALKAKEEVLKLIEG